MNKNTTRDEIEDKYKWDLSVLYASDDGWEEDYRKVEKELSQLLEFKGTLADSSKLEQFMKMYTDFSIVKENLYVYANVRFFEDTRNTTYEEMKGRIELLVSKISAETVFIKKELSSLSEGNIDKLIDEQAWQLLLNRTDKNWSLVDCSSFIVMQQNKLIKSLTTDHHFEQAGFIRLLK